LLGLYSRRLTGRAAFWSSIIGIAVGALFFPKPDFTPWLNIPFAGDLLVSFIAPVVVSSAIIWIWDAIARHKSNVTLFDFETLKTDIHRYGDQPLTPTALEANQ
jgi:Na+/proline symporter